MMQDCAMGFRRFTTSEYESLRTLHNVIALVGNGFGIQPRPLRDRPATRGLLGEVGTRQQP